ncbi:MAG: CbiX/SirB N-terminal domain-containing protein [Peptococcaceae bacterium]|nr:CbiX/SirB N-terminal domain-containing protein [Peptococcaceae bacterium]
MKTGIILLSHGSRLPDALNTLHELVEKVKAGGDFDLVTGASLQFNQPDLQTAVARTVSAGMDRIIVAPLFLYMGMHMKKDIPEILDQERKKYPHVRFDMTGNIGADNKLAEILLDRIGKVVSSIGSN